MAISLKSKRSCPVCHMKTHVVKITSFLKVCPKCASRVS